MLRKVKVKWFDLTVYCAVIVLVICPVIKLGDLPGLYLDAINPDYAAVQILFPREHQERWMVSWPWLTQIYHGNINILLTLAAVLMTGTTGVLQHHILYAAICVVCTVLLYRLLILREIGVSRYIAAGVVLITATLPSVFTLIITQYFIELFGTACILAGTIFYFRWKGEDGKKAYIIAGYFLFGIAFYSYFNLFFFLPFLIAGTLLHLRKERAQQTGLLIQCGAYYLLGCSFYFIGYTDIFLSVVCDDTGWKNTLLFIFGFIMYGMLGGICRLSEKKRKLTFAVAGVCAVGMVYWMLTVLPAIGSYAESINAAGESAGIGERFRRIFFWLTTFLNGMGAEYGIYQDIVTAGSGVIWCIIVILGMALFWVECKEHKLLEYSVCKSGLGVVGSYLFCLLFFATRVHGQHFVPLIFMLMFLSGLIVDELIRVWGGKSRKTVSPVIMISTILVSIGLVFGIRNFYIDSKLEYYTMMVGYLVQDLKYLILFLLLIMTMIALGGMFLRKRETFCNLLCFLTAAAILGINLFNEFQIIRKIELTGGVHLFTEQINQLAAEALENEAEGIKEVYVFPEWGFLFGFNYLTVNQIEATSNAEPGHLQPYLEEGYRIVMCYWSKEEKEQYESLFKALDARSRTANEIRYQRDGEEAFYIMSLEK